MPDYLALKQQQKNTEINETVKEMKRNFHILLSHDQAERLKEMLKQKYSRQKEETDEMEKRRQKLETQMAQVEEHLVNCKRSNCR